MILHIKNGIKNFQSDEQNNLSRCAVNNTVISTKL